MKKPSHAQKGLKIAQSMAAAASELRLPVEVVQNAKNSGCGAFRDGGRIDCDALRAWLDADPTRYQLANGQIDKRVEDALRIRADRQTREFKLQVLKEQYLHVDDIRRDYTRAVYSMKSKLLASARVIAMEMRMHF